MQSRGLWLLETATAWAAAAVACLPHLQKFSRMECCHWAVVNELNLSYDSKETMRITIDPYYGNLY